MRQMRFVLAVVIAPLFVPLTSIFFELIYSGNLSLYDDQEILLLIWSSTVAYYVGLFAAVLPIIHVLQIMQRVTLRAIVAAGALSGIVVYFVLQSLVGLLFDIPAISLIELVACVIFGAVVAFVFGVIAGVNNLRMKENGV